MFAIAIERQLSIILNASELDSLLSSRSAGGHPFTLPANVSFRNRNLNVLPAGAAHVRHGH
jgi:hypothetical protein